MAEEKIALDVGNEEKNVRSRLAGRVFRAELEQYLRDRSGCTEEQAQMVCGWFCDFLVSRDFEISHGDALRLMLWHLPDAAPASWRSDRAGRENPVAFIKRHYGEWLGRGLTRAHIRKLDRPLYNALGDYLRRRPLPADVWLPTRADAAAFRVASVTRAKEAGRAVLLAPDEAGFARLASAMRRNWLKSGN